MSKMENSLEGFYKSTEEREREGGFQEVIEINRDHYIFKAHFPGNPITPGVCLIQICKELIEKHLNVTLVLKKGKNIKFLNVISPIENDTICFDVNLNQIERNILSSIVIYKDDLIFAKLSLEYTII